MTNATETKAAIEELAQPYYVNAAPRKMDFVDGTFWMLSPLRDIDISILTNWVQQRYAEVALEAAKTKAEMPERILRLWMESAQRVAPSLSPFNGEGLRITNSIDGWAMVLWLGVKQNHPDVTFEECRRKLPDSVDGKRNREKLWDLIQKLQGFNSQQLTDAEKNSPKKDEKKGATYKRKESIKQLQKYTGTRSKK